MFPIAYRVYYDGQWRVIYSKYNYEGLGILYWLYASNEPVRCAWEEELLEYNLEPPEGLKDATS